MMNPFAHKVRIRHMLARCCIASAMILPACTAITDKLGIKDDNFVEEVTEDYINARTGWRLDLTGRSPE